MGFKTYNGKTFEVNGDRDIILSHIAENTNLCDPSKIVVGLLTSTGTVNTASTTARTTDFIPVKEGQILSCVRVYDSGYILNPLYECTKYYENHRYIVFFKEDKSSVVSYDNTNINVENGTNGVVVPTGAFYARVSWASTYGAFSNGCVDCCVFCSDEFVVNPVRYEYNTQKIYADKNLLNNTKLSWFGDSLSDAYGGHDWQKISVNVTGAVWNDYGYITRIARENGMIVDNRAVSGTNIDAGHNGNYTDSCGVNQLDIFLNEMATGAECPSRIMIMFGGNSVVDNLGSLTNTSADIATTAGAVRYFVEKLRELQLEHPYMQYGFILSPPSTWDNTSTVKDIDAGRAMIKSVLDDIGNVPYFDLSTQSEMTLDMAVGDDLVHVVKSLTGNVACYNAIKQFVKNPHM